MIRNISFFLLGLIIGTIVIGVTFYIKNSNYYLDHPLFKTPRYTLKIRIHTTCDSLQVFNATGSLINQFTHLQRPDQLMVSFDRTEMNKLMTVKAYCNNRALTIDSLFQKKFFKHIFIENDIILEDTIAHH